MSLQHRFSLFILLLLRPSFSTGDSVLSSTESLTLSSNRTLVSPGDVFELGFFKAQPSFWYGDRWYLGIWFKRVPERTYVWVANRDSPLSKPMGALRVSKCSINLFDQSDKLVWSTSETGECATSSPVVAELLADGNFVLRHSNNSDPDDFLWQSFDWPTNTLLPQMKLNWLRRTKRTSLLTSWKSVSDPSSGDFAYGIEANGPARGIPEMFIWKWDTPVYRILPWEGADPLSGTGSIGVPDNKPVAFITFTLTEKDEETTFSFRSSGKSSISFLRLTSRGVLSYFMWNEEIQEWDIPWVSIAEDCQVYNFCGRNSYCESNMSGVAVCSCMRGFVNPQVWVPLNRVSGCVRKRELNCSEDDGFFRLSNIKLPDTTNASLSWGIDFPTCEKMCLGDCYCTAFAIFAKPSSGGGRSGCILWTTELLDVRKYVAAGQDLYVRVNEKKKPKTLLIACLSVGLGLLVIAGAIFCYCWIRKKKRAAEHFPGEIMMEDLELPLLDFETISTATNNFSEANFLGKGGFGVVHKGILDGQEIAVKRLSKVSGQGIEEFKNELRLITKVQHVNLVRLIGYSLNRDEKLLVFEYMENRSLDLYLFDETQRSKLTWQRRYEIAKGVARGMSYLHHDSRTIMIIHRDLKPSNVLLDKDMTPKISDFGMARIFTRGENEVETTKVVGTYGYMSPEYSQDGTYSEKSDVFSFGVLVLEIVTGKRNKGFADSNNGISLLTYVYKKWKEGEWADVIDPMLDPSSSQEVKRCLQVGLLCVQDRREDRPTMPSVVLLLLSETEVTLQPNPPGYYVEGNTLQNVASSSYTLQNVSLPTVEPR